MSGPRVRCLIVFEPPDAKARRMTLSETAAYYRDHFLRMAPTHAVYKEVAADARWAASEVSYDDERSSAAMSPLIASLARLDALLNEDSELPA